MSENFLFHNQESEFDFGGSCSLSAGVRCPAHGGTPMTVRTTRMAISLSRPFKCRDLDAHKPAGDTLLYREEELIEGLSNLACQRVATLLEKIALAELSRRRPASRALALPNHPTG
jgi:hypothetical protein